MKVTKGQVEFEPIIMTIENEDEAKIIWACLNRGVTASGVSDLVKNLLIPRLGVKTRMWDAFDRVYDPR